MAKSNRDKWHFYNVPARKRLTAEEASYWTRNLSRILKVGMEVEVNLPENKEGTCKGNNTSCPCTSLSMENGCWQQCVNSQDCSIVNRDPETCEAATEACKPEACKNCDTAKCIGIFCSNFVSACCVCGDYDKACGKCKYLFDPKKNPDAIRKALKQELQPNNSYGQVSPTGVHSIVQDGSLLGGKGAEVITIGRRIDYWEFFKMAEKVIKELDSRGAYMNERCSIHMHVLASYYGKTVPSPEKMGVPSKVNEMERDMPEIIVANLHQLVRRYQNAMTWMIMGLNEMDRLTRWERFRVSVLPISAVANHMRSVRDEVSQHAGGNKYGWINYNQLGFSGETGDVNRFHVEFRAADGIMCPTAIAALACMYYALVIKAVQVSRYGTLEIGDEGWFEQASAVKEALLNNRGDWSSERFSDTSNLMQYKDILVEESLSLVRQLKPILIKIGPAFDVLEKLAEKPVALCRAEGQDWSRIEESLAVITSDEDKLDIVLQEITTLNLVSDCENVDEWVATVGEELRENPEVEETDQAQLEETIKGFINRYQECGDLVWSKKIGAPIMI